MASDCAADQMAASILTLAEAELAELYPAYLRLDRQGRILAAGPSLVVHGGAGLVGAAFFERFTVERPGDIGDVAALGLRRRPIILRLNGAARAIRLRGVGLDRPDGVWLLLGHIPDLDRSEAAPALQFSDFSPTDGTLDMLLAAEIRSGLLAEARALAVELEKQRKAAERANKAKSAFLATMSHEIRTPMNGVLGLAAILADTALTDAQREMLDVMTASGRLLMDTLNDVLDISKIESGKMDLEETTFDLDALVSGVGLMFAPIAAGKGLGFELILEPCPFWRRGDPVRIRQILVNLISNAIKFTDAGQVRAEVAIHDAADGPVLELTVRDTGIGMSADALGRLFQPFVQADGSMTRRFGGTGLGLAITKLLCDQMKGEIKVDSRLGRGSIFTVQLPLPQAKAPSPDGGGLDGGGPEAQAAPHVLVVEDNATNRFVLTLFLDKLGMTYDIAQNGAEALLAWERGVYDVILMDIEMPVLDGLETTRELRRREQAQARRYTPIVALSADAMVESSLRARQVGMDDFVTKPIELDRLERIIRGQSSRNGAKGPDSGGPPTAGD